MHRMHRTFSALVAVFLAAACSQEPSTSPTRLDPPSGSSAFQLGTAGAANRDLPAFDDELDPDEEPCARGGGFWCQNQDGGNPNLTREEWEAYLNGAVALLASEGVVTSEREVAEAVCDVRRQLFRQLASLALNLAAGLVHPDQALMDENDDIDTVGDAFELGAEVYALGDAVPFEERQAIKDTMDRINNNVILANECPIDDELPDDDRDDDDFDDGEPDGEEDPDDGEAGPLACGVEGGGPITICHVPPGNPAARHTITIGTPAWPAHEAHGDTCGPC